MYKSVIHSFLSSIMPCRRRMYISFLRFEVFSKPFLTNVVGFSLTHSYIYKYRRYAVDKIYDLLLIYISITY